MPVTVKYANGTAAVFADADAAVAQAAHDRSWPGHVNPVMIVDGDHADSHTNWGPFTQSTQQYSDAAIENLTVLYDEQAVAELACQCAQCKFQREAPNLNHEERGLLMSRLLHEQEAAAS